MIRAFASAPGLPAPNDGLEMFDRDPKPTVVGSRGRCGATGGFVPNPPVTPPGPLVPNDLGQAESWVVSQRCFDNTTILVLGQRPCAITRRPCAGVRQTPCAARQVPAG